MKPRSPRMIYLMIVSGMILILGAAVFGLVELQKDRANRSLSKVAKPVIKMDLLAPMDHGWISDHEIFFLREKNQGDFMCLKADIRDGKETLLEALSPYLRDKEDRSIPFEMQASPSGKRIGMLFGSKSDREIYIHDLKTNETLSIENKPVTFFMETWLPDESGWVVWIPEKTPSSEASSYYLSPTIIGPELSELPISEVRLPPPAGPDLFLDQKNLLMSFYKENKDFTFDLSLAIVELPGDKNPVFNQTQVFTSDFPMSGNFQFSHDEKGNRWIIGHRTRGTIWKIERKNTFPYVGINTRRYQLQLYKRGPNRTTTLDPDVEIQYPSHIKLNPSGTHFSFVYQGQIWVAAIDDMLPF
ncbi:MAG: hypothetical protein O2964_14025 [Verrucomicrobia bacterium]|nr:hypothetical protein [Verrucomicrobiota bacterium]